MIGRMMSDRKNGSPALGEASGWPRSDEARGTTDYSESGGRDRSQGSAKLHSDHDRLRLARVARTVKIGPFGPNAKAIVVAGGELSMTMDEALSIADVILASSWLQERMAGAWDEAVTEIDMACGGASHFGMIENRYAGPTRQSTES